MDERLRRLLMRQQASGFEDLGGAEAALTIPVSDRLLNEIIAEALPRPSPVRDLHVAPKAGDRFAVRGRLTAASFLPALNLSLVIDRQPEFPGFPVLVLRLESSGLLSLAGPALRFIDALPKGIRVEQDRIHVDLPALLERHGLVSYLAFVEQLRVNTIEGALILTVRAAVRPAR